MGDAVYLRDAGGPASDGQHEACWVPCAEGDPGAVEFLAAGDARDAARWRALLNVPRIRMQGSAGVDPHTGERTSGTHVHFGAEFWADMGTSYDRGRDPQNQREWGVHCLTAMADAILEREDSAKAPT